MCIDPNWLPFEAFDENGKHIGFNAEYFKIFQDRLPIPIQIIKTDSWNQSLLFAKERKCDILSLAMKTPKREEHFSFTLPYLKIPLVLATTTDKPFLNDFYTLSEKLAIPKGYAFAELLKAQYPNLNIVSVENIQDGLEKVVQGEVFGYIGTLTSVGYYFQKGFTGEIKIAGKFDRDWELGVGVRDDDKILLDIFNKLILDIDETTHKAIFNRWIKIEYDEKIDYNLLWKILMGVFVLSVAFFYYQRKLTLLNNSLEQRVEEELKKSRDTDKLIFQQNKLISMGEMIENIAHQWRQPLASINNLVILIDKKSGLTN
ncbi:MAG: transporter substrate-binding domain-containing protein [Campylobacterota bacterium]|nr:transporter substrate-binding domain-containing protein [Campylobacterota bacterium]